MRFERKYRIEGMNVEAIRAMVHAHPMGFSNLYEDRQVNNIYLDTPDLRMFSDNLFGNSEREKFRIRWYGKDLKRAESPVLETKRKINELGDKLHQPLSQSLELTTRSGVQKYVDQYCFGPLPLQPTLINSYQRSYLISPDHKFRLTIDWDLEFHSMEYENLDSTLVAQDHAIIVEVKYEEKEDEHWSDFAQQFPFRVSKNSKYVNGLMLTGNV